VVEKLATVGTAELSLNLLYSGSQKSEVGPMPTEAYALCPRRAMPSSHLSEKGYNY